MFPNVESPSLESHCVLSLRYIACLFFVHYQIVMCPASCLLYSASVSPITCSCVPLNCSCVPGTESNPVSSLLSSSKLLPRSCLPHWTDFLVSTLTHSGPHIACSALSCLPSLKLLLLFGRPLSAKIKCFVNMAPIIRD